MTGRGVEEGPRPGRRGSRGGHRCAAAACLLVAGLLAVAGIVAFGAVAAGAAESPAPPELPTLVVEAPPSLADLAERLRGFDRSRLEPAMRLTGLTRPGPPIRVILAPEGTPAAAAAPVWASGYADGRSGVVVLLPNRVPRYPDENLESLVRHEVAHVLIARAAGGGPVPRWFNEGLAMAAARIWGFSDRTRVAWDVLIEGRTPLTELEDTFRHGRGDAQAAYALSQDFVQDLLQRYGDGVGAEILRRVAGGKDFEAAFADSTGDSLASVEASYWRRRTFWNRWVPFLTSSAALWMAVTLLALVAIRRRRRRTAELYERWEQEERAVPEALEAHGEAHSEQEELLN